MDTLSPNGQPHRHNTTKRRSGGFLLGGSLGHKARRVSPNEGGRARGRLDGEDEDTFSASSPQSRRSSKSQGKTPLYAEQPAEQSRTPSASRTRNNAVRHSWAPSVSTGRASAMSQTSDSMNNRASLDANQLIQMALTLSEGRRRAASGLNTPPAMKSHQRVTSNGDTGATVTPGSPYANDTVRRKTRLSEGFAATTSDAKKDAGEDDTSAEDGSFWTETSDVSYEFSIACLQRAEKAKKYFELSHQYRKLLNSLTPLRPQMSDDGSGTLQLGREYNPLQYLRNERIRHERGLRLFPGPDAFEDVQQVTAYVNATEKVRTRHQEREGEDYPALPDIRYFSNDAKEQHSTHTRSGTASSRILWHDSEWTVHPTALLADVVWAEDWRNRGLLEDRLERRIFPQLNPQSPGSEHPQSAISARSRAGTLEEANNDVKASPGRGRQKRKFLSMHKIEHETARILHWNRGRSRSMSRGSSRSSVSTYGTMGYEVSDGINIGPLARHMRREMRYEDVETPSEIPSAGARWDDLQSPMESDGKHLSRAPTNSAGNFDSRLQANGKPSGDMTRRRSFNDGIGVVTSNTDSRHGSQSERSLFDDRRFVQSATEPSKSFSQEMIDGNPESIYGTNFGSDADFGSSHRNSSISATDFAAMHDAQDRRSNSLDYDRRGLEMAPLREHHELEVPTQQPALRRRLTSSSENGPSTGKGVNKAISRILKDNVIVGLMRGEGSRKTPRVPASTSEVDVNDVFIAGGVPSLRRTDSNGSQSSKMEARRKYDAPLPTFTFPSRENGPATEQPTGSTETGEGSLLSRQNSGKVPRLEIPREGTGSREETEELPASSSMLSLLSPLKLLRTATTGRSPFASGVNSTQGSTVSLVARDRGAARPARTRTGTASTLEQRRWSIADGLVRTATSQKQAVSMRDVARVRALFLSSGIKACELCHRGQAWPTERLPLLVAAEMEVGKRAGEVRRCDEYRIAGKLWRKAIVDLHRSSENELQLYRSKILPEMREKIETLRHATGEELTAKLRTTADEADAFATDLSTQQTLAIKEVHDTLDGLLRRRRRNVRLLRRAGFLMLEWLVVMIMWLLWFVFSLFRMVRCTLRFSLRSARWMTSF